MVEMFGQTDDNQSGGATTTAQAPSMLDNVTAQDFQTTDPATQAQYQPPAQQYAPYTPQFPPVSATQQPQQPEPQAPVTNDSPFTQNPIVSTPAMAPAPTTTADISPFGTFADYAPPQSSSPSGPVAPPVVLPSESSSTEITSAPTPQPISAPVDQAKLADMKQQALSHLEPLADHLDGTPEETFKTTMMMIQANDNHTLLEKALNSAKEIEDDKARAQAMLDIVNEINYFSQDN